MFPGVCWSFLRCLFGRKFHIPKLLNLGHQDREPFKMHLLHFPAIQSEDIKEIT